jgi:hypothetical protein
MPKATKAEISQRVSEVAQLRASGAEIQQIAEYAEKAGWGIKLTQCYEYVHRADAVLANYIERNRDALLAKRLIRRSLLWSKALQAGDLHLALAVEKDETALLGLYPARDKTPSAVVVQNATPVVSESDRLALLALAQARLRGGVGEEVGEGGEPADGQVLPGTGVDPGGRGEVAGRLVDPVAAGAAVSNAAPVLRTEPPVLPVRRTEQPVLAGPPGPGEERSVCTLCGRRYLRQPGVPWTGCPACNAP